MKSSEMAVKAAKKEFYEVYIAPASSHPVKLFKIIRYLISLSEGAHFLNTVIIIIISN